MSRLKRLLQRDAEDRPGAFARVKLRRRLDRQERMREALLLDLGAIIFELHRQRRREPELLQAKAAELEAVDEEVRAIAHALGGGSDLPELTASGLVAACTSCGSLMGNRDRFCSHCGVAAGTTLPGSENGGPPELHGDEPEHGPDGPELEASPEEEAFEDAAPEAEEDGQRQSQSSRVQEDLVRLAQGKLRAGRRAARRWFADRRAEAR